MIATLLLLTQLQFASGTLDTKPNNHLPFKLDSTNSCVFLDRSNFFILTETEKILVASLLQSAMADNFHQFYYSHHYLPDYSAMLHFNFDIYINSILSDNSYKLSPYKDTYGDKYVWVNCIRTHGKQGKDYCDHNFRVYDGGDYYFNFYVNLSKMTFCCFTVNGEA